MHYAPEPSGNAPYTTGLATGLAGRGYEVTVVTGVPHYPAWQVTEGYGAWRARTDERGVDVTRLRHYVTRRPTAPRRIAMEVTFGLRCVPELRRGSDVVVCVSPALLSSAMSVAQVSRRRDRPALGLWVQDLYSRGVVETGGTPGWLSGGVARLEGAVLRCCDGVAVVHDRFKEQVVRLGMPEDRVEVLRNWTHVGEAPAADVPAVRSRLGWPPGVTVALHAGNMGVKQGLENVVSAAREAHLRGEPVRFVLLGGGNQRELLRAQARDLPTVEFLESLPDDRFAEALAAADVLLVNERPGVHEMSVPSKLTSYYTSGRPVVVAAEPGSVTASEISLSGAGLRVDPGDPAALLAAVQRLGADPAAAAALGEHGRRFHREHLTAAAALDGFETWLRTLVAVRDRTGDRTGRTGTDR